MLIKIAKNKNCKTNKFNKIIKSKKSLKANEAKAVKVVKKVDIVGNSTANHKKIIKNNSNAKQKIIKKSLTKNIKSKSKKINKNESSPLSSTKNANKKIIKINWSKKEKTSNDETKINKNFIDWSKINLHHNPTISVNEKNIELHNLKSNSDLLLVKLKGQLNKNNLSPSDNLQGCALSYAKKRVAKYIANRRAKNSYNLNRHQSLIKKIKSESLKRPSEDHHGNSK